MNTSQENLLVFIQKKCNQPRIRKVIKIFVNWCEEIYTHCRENKTTNFLLKLEIKFKYDEKQSFYFQMI